MVSNPMGQPPTKGDCKVFQAQQGLDSRILYDPTIATKIYGNKETFMVTNGGPELVYKAKKKNIADVEQAIISVLQSLGSPQ